MSAFIFRYVGGQQPDSFACNFVEFDDFLFVLVLANIQVMRRTFFFKVIALIIPPISVLERRQDTQTDNQTDTS